MDKPKKRKAAQRLNFADLTEAQKAYIAGFIDGDGSIFAQCVPQVPPLTGKNSYPYGYQMRVTVSFHQKTKRIHHLRQLADEIGLGQVRVKNAVMSELVIVGVVACKPFLKAIIPYLRMKKKQAQLVLKIIEQLPSAKVNPLVFLYISELADQVADLNDSKNREHTAIAVAAHMKTKGFI